VTNIERDKLEVDRILQEQGRLLANKAKSRWYNEGERSNKYFLNLLKRRGDKQEMRQLQIDGTIISDETEIRSHVTTFYNDLYNNTHPVDIDATFLNEMFTVDELHQRTISAPITLAELWAALKGVRATTPGPDGISNAYLKKLWDLVGPLILAAWEYSINGDQLPPSHKKSLLRLIPKAGKDLSQLKNWRPITLSNCDHKLITRLYNNRILRAVEKHISPTQTAYIKGRNIADNLRLLGAAVRLTEHEHDLDATVIALDAQKAFDSVQHEYLVHILNKIGLSTFVPIFRLLYKDLSNDILINGAIGEGYKLGNGVKQGDALSCSLFLLAMEPLIRNISANQRVTPITSTILPYTWPKILGYADDITVLTQNSNNCVNEIFYEYQRLTKASGLHLNADKTEKFNITGTHANDILLANHVMYNGTSYEVRNQNTIKINGIYYHLNAQQMALANYTLMKEKMCKHFTTWSRRDLSLLGKVQIIKTFGISQYLYSLAVTDLTTAQWSEAQKLMYKFLWNKHFLGNAAPHRIRKAIVTTPKEMGGLGMVEFNHIVQASRVRRFSLLRAAKHHPVERLQEVLGGYEYMRPTPKLAIDVVTSNVLKILRHNIETMQFDMRPGLAESDLILHKLVANCRLRWIIDPTKVNSIEYNMLRARRLRLVRDVIHGAPGDMRLLGRILRPRVREVVILLGQIYNDLDILDRDDSTMLYQAETATWLQAAAVSSSKIRRFLFPVACLTSTKLINMTEDVATALYRQINSIVSTRNKTNMYRLLHGDVYSGTRLVRFGLSEIDRCIRCFEAETSRHLLMECPYSMAVWRTLGVDPDDPLQILDGDLPKSEFETRAEFINLLVFRKIIMPPDILVKTVMVAFANRLSRRTKTTLYAKAAVERFATHAQWYHRPGGSPLRRRGGRL
jgi:hypothetical protein